MLYERNKKTLQVRVIVIISLAFAIYSLILFGNHPQAVEQYYSNGVYPIVCLILHPFFNLFPFSVGDTVYIFTIGYLCYAVFRLIKLAYKKAFRQAGIYLLGLLAGIETGILIFYILWGMNYYRPPAGDLLNLRDTGYTTADLRAVTAMLIDSANTTRSRVTAGELTTDNNAIYQTAIGAVRKLSHNSVNFQAYSPDIKPSLLTPLLNYIGTSGYYNPFTSEAQMNYQMPVFERPVVACHEMSHQAGFATEDEANFAGFVAGIGSNDHLLRYSAYHLAVDELMHALRYRDTIANNELKPCLSSAVRNDFKTERKYWISYQSRAGALSSIFYDKFLKANNQPHGLGTYNRMVLLVMALYKKSIVHGS